jgi:deoxyribose-phosphate aldolase
MDRGDTGTALAGLIDHTILAPDATSLQVSRFCEEALAYAFCSVCVNSRFVPLVTRLLHGSGVRCCAVSSRERHKGGRGGVGLRRGRAGD